MMTAAHSRPQATDRLLADKERAADLESTIAFAARRLAAARTRALRLTAWTELKRLHSLRDAAQVARLEQKRGLR